MTRDYEEEEEEEEDEDEDAVAFMRLGTTNNALMTPREHLDTSDFALVVSRLL